MTTKRNGVREWLFQRFSNVLIFVFAGVYIGSILSMDSIDYATWSAFHTATWFKVFASVTLVIAMVNSLLAGWQIGTDYTQKIPIPGFGVMFHTFYTVASIGLLAFGLYILW